MPEKIDWESAVLDSISDGTTAPEDELVNEQVEQKEEQQESAPEATITEPAKAETQPETQTEVKAENEPEKKSVPDAVIPAETKEATNEPTFKNEESRILYQAILEGKDSEVAAFLANKQKDYNTMSDTDVLREHMKAQNPLWTEKDIDLEIKHKYAPIPERIDVCEIDERDYDEIEKANEHNERVDYLENVREREARIARAELEKTKPQVELPKIDFSQPQETFTPEQIQEANRQWEAAVESEIPKLSDIKFKVGDEEVTYKVDDNERKEFTDLMKDFNDVDYLTKRGWYDEQGKMNILKVAEDVRLLEKTPKIIASLATQMKNSAKKEVISKDIKNLDLEGNKANSSTTKKKSFEDTVYDA